MAEMTFEEQLEAARKEDEKFVETPAPADEAPTVDETPAEEITAEMWERAQKTLKDTAKKLLLAEGAVRIAQNAASDAYSEGYSEGYDDGQADCAADDAAEG